MAAYIGIYGGSFNPIHNGHLHLLAGFREGLPLSKLLVIPAGVPPHKIQAGNATWEDRLKMCQLAVELLNRADLPGRNRPRIEVSDLEVRRQGRSYTVDTLKQLEECYPKTRRMLLMGEDMFRTLGQWFRAEEIFRLAEICVAPRSETPLSGLQDLGQAYLAQFQGRIRYLPLPYLNLSSTQIRARTGAGLPIAGLVPAKVADYIRQRGLYAGAER